MTGRGRLRRIGDPVVAAAPAGVRIRTRIHLSAAESAALAAVGTYLGVVYRAELAGRARLGRLDRESHGAWRAQRKQAITAVASSRWAGAITRTVEDQYQLGVRGLAMQVGDEHHGGSAARRRRGYRNAGERFAKTRRLAVLKARLASAQEALAAGRPAITVGGKRLWRSRNHLDQAGISEQLWRDRWDAARMFLTADGESGKAGGNETIRVNEAGVLRVKVPAALVGELGAHTMVAAPVRFAYRGEQWMTRVAARRAVRYDIHFDPDRGAGTWMPPGKPPPNPSRHSRICVPAGCSALT